MEPLTVRVPPEDYRATALELWAANEIEVNHQRIKDALALAGNIDGAHHKQYTIDQMVRALTGDAYDQWVADYEHCDTVACPFHDGGDQGRDCDQGYSWDEGIAP